MSVFLKLATLTLAITVIGCQSTGKEVVHYDKKAGAVYVYAARDSRSVMPKANKVPSIKNEADRLKSKLRKDPNNAGNMISLAQLQVARGDLEDAEGLARKILARDFSNRPAKIVLAQVAYMQGKNHVAGAILKRLGKSKKTESEVLNLLAMIELQEGDPAKAFDLIRVAIKANPDDIAARMNLGIFYLRFRKVDLAQSQFKEILKRMPENLDAKLHLGITYAAQGNVKKAKSIYQELSGKDKNPIIDFNVAVLKMRSKDYDGALSALKSYIKRHSTKARSVLAAQELIEDIRLNRAARSTLSDDDIEELAESLNKGGSGGGDDSFTGNPMTNAH